MMDARLVELETKIAFQDDLVQSLNETVAAQQRELDRLRAELEALTAQVRALAPSLVARPEDEAPPPHY